jgi:hypothetical protein
MCRESSQDQVALSSRKYSIGDLLVTEKCLDGDATLMADRPLCALAHRHLKENAKSGNDVIYKPAYDDLLGILVARMYMGDGTAEVILMQNARSWSIFIFQIVFTLVKLDTLLGFYSHHDLGLKNILLWAIEYDVPAHNANALVLEYRLFDKHFSFLAPNLLPILWDFDHSRFARVKNHQKYYAYMPDGSLPELTSEEFRERHNDIYVLLTDIETKTGRSLSEIGIVPNDGWRERMGVGFKEMNNTQAALLLMNEYLTVPSMKREDMDMTNKITLSLS